MRNVGQQAHLRREFQMVLYRLKMSYGVSMSLYLEQQGTFDVITGITPITYSSIDIDRAIIFPSEAHRDIFQSISFLKANSNFALGGDVQLYDRQMMIDGKDLPQDYVITKHHYAVWDSSRWDITKVVRLEHGSGWLLNTRRIEGQKTFQILSQSIVHTLTVQSEFTIGQ